MRVMHLLHRSAPGTHGYAVRSRQIVTSQLAKGLEPLVVTSPSQAPQGTLDPEGSEFIDGVRYFRTCGKALPPTKEVWDRSAFRAALRVAQNFFLLKTAISVARKYRPDVIHAHSPFTCGIIGNMVGRLFGIPTIYEMRGLWEDSHVGRSGFTERSLRYAGVRFLENLALRGADRCCVISEALKAEVQSRGVAPEKVVMVPNGVETRVFVPGEPNGSLRAMLGLEGVVTIGYIGSFFIYEGLDLLVEALPGLAADFPDLRLLLVGDGELMPTLKEMASKPDLAGRVIFTGRVRHEETPDYYRLCDLFVLPRRNTRETRLVTPLKPLEIMAMGKALIASDIGGHREMVEDGATGLLFRSEDVLDLQAKCRTVLTNEQLRRELAVTARRWVESHRDWGRLVDTYVELYVKLVDNTNLGSNR